MYVVAKGKNIDALVDMIFNLNDSLYYNCPDKPYSFILLMTNLKKSTEYK